MIVTARTRSALAIRREQRDLERQGYRKHETDWEIHRGARYNEVIVDAKVQGQHLRQVRLHENWAQAMTPPTKFELMRRNRSMAAYRAAKAAESPAQVVSKIAAGEYRAVLPPAPAVPTMKIDGASYREVKADGCSGCAFVTQSRCRAIEPHTELAFGGPCEVRSVIYVRAD